MEMALGWGWGGDREGVLCVRKFLILARDWKVQRNVGRVLDAKEEREAEERTYEESNDNKDNGGSDGGELGILL